MAKKVHRVPAPKKRMAKATAKKSTPRSSTRSKPRSVAKGSRGPRAQRLPGTEQIRSAVLDELCEEYGDIEETINTHQKRVKEIKGEALQEMQRTNGKTYKHAGVVFSRTPGADKLNARLTKDHGDADDATPAQGEGEDAAAGTGADLESQG